MELQDYIKILKKRKWIAITSIIVVLIIYSISSITSSRGKTYLAKSEIIMDSAIIPEEILPSCYNPLPYLPMFTQIHLIKTKPVIEQVIEEVKNKGIEVDFEEAKNSVEAYNIGDTSFIRIEVKTNNPKKSIYLANAFAKVITTENHKLRKARLTSAKYFIENQIKKQEQKINNIEQKIAELNKKHHVIDLNKEIYNQWDTLNNYKRQIEEIKIKKNYNKMLIEKYYNELKNVKQYITKEKVVPNPVYSNIQQEIHRLEIEKNREQKDNLRYKAIETQIDTLKNRLHTTIPKFVNIPVAEENPLYLHIWQSLFDAQTNQILLNVKENTMNLIYNNEYKKLKNISTEKKEYIKLKAEEELVKNILTELHKTKSELILKTELKIGDAQIANLAKTAEVITPMQSSITIYSFPFLLGIIVIVGVASVVVAELLDDVIHKFR